MLKAKGQRKRIGWFPADYVTLLGTAATALNIQTTQLAVSLCSALKKNSPHMHLLTL